jgi:uncharacterized membrane protein
MAETTQSGLSDNAIGAISYITFVPAIVFLVLPPYNTSSFVRFHCWQSISFNGAALAVWITVNVVRAMMFFLFTYAFWILVKLIALAWIMVVILCVVNAVNGKRFKLPIIGQLAEKQAGA